MLEDKNVFAKNVMNYNLPGFLDSYQGSKYPNLGKRALECV